MKKIISVLLVLALAFALCGCGTDLRLKASLVQDGELNELLEQSSAVLSFNSDDDGAVIGLEASIPGINSVKGVLTVGSEGLGFTLPGIDDTYYLIKWDVFKDVAEDATSMDFSSFSAADLPLDDLSEIFSRYFGIITSLIGEGTTAETKTVTLTGLQTSLDAQVITICPTQDAWAQFFTTVFATAKDDAQLKSLIEQALAFGYQSSEDLQDAYDSAEAFSADILAQFDDLLAQGLANADNFAAVVAGATLELVQEDSRIYAVNVKKDGMGLGYEGFGDFADTRSDGLFLYMGSSAMKVLLNTFQNTEDAFTTVAISDLINLNITGTVSKTEATSLGIPVSYLNAIVEDFGFYVSVDSEEPDTVFELGGLKNGSEGVVEDAFSLTVRTDGSPSEITAPDAEPTYITSMEQLQEAMESIQEKFEAYVA